MFLTRDEMLEVIGDVGEEIKSLLDKVTSAPKIEHIQEVNDLISNLGNELFTAACTTLDISQGTPWKFVQPLYRTHGSDYSINSAEGHVLCQACRWLVGQLRGLEELYDDPMDEVIIEIYSLYCLVMTMCYQFTTRPH